MIQDTFITHQLIHNITTLNLVIIQDKFLHSGNYPTLNFNNFGLL